MDAGAWISLGSAVGVLASAAVGYGLLHGRVKALEDRMNKVEEVVKAVGTLTETVGRIDERTKTTKEAVERIENRLDEPQSFAPRARVKPRSP
jgi:hypothetical protein